jgi:hypothetical protein
MFSDTHLYLTIHGTQTNNGAPDEWQVGLRMKRILTLATEADYEQAVIEYRDDVQLWWGTIRGSYNASTTCDRVKLALVGTDGRYSGAEGPYEADLAAGTRNGQGGQPALPAQLAIAVSLRTDKTRGLASRGRIFLPAPTSFYLSNTGGIDAATVTQMATATGTLLNNLNNAPGPDGTRETSEVGIFSRVGAGAYEKVTRVEVGRRFDVQRRRAEKIPETPVSAPVAVG